MLEILQKQNNEKQTNIKRLRKKSTLGLKKKPEIKHGEIPNFIYK